MDKNNQSENAIVPKSDEDKSLSVQISEKYRLYIDTLYEKIISNLNSWTFHYWLFFYGAIPFVLLIIALLSSALPTEIFRLYFIQNQANFFSISTYVSNFSHMNISHLVTNLILYIISITVIFIFEENKKRLFICTVFFLTIVPIVGAYLTQLIWEIAHAINGQNFGFSAITIAYTGYALYIFIKWFYVNSILGFAFKCSESEIINSIRNTLSMKEQSAEKIHHNIFFIVIFFLFGLIMINIMKFGIEAGQYTQSSAGISNGIGHFQGFILGLLTPTVFGLFFEKTERVYDLFFAFLILIGVWFYYSQYLAVLLFH